ncbi:MAG: 2'-5' RNA ligase family protein [Candidatus Wallbacteria bacterium]|nr:2'-5' RNA ligase family protein [Candidatus Wallbacteria bacterium]
MPNYRVLITLLLISFLACLPAAGREAPEFTISSSIHDTAKLEFQEHAGSGAFDSYLIQDLPYAPVKKLWKDIEAATGLTLKNRGEAHITVITPVEYNQVLKKHISIKDINRIAKDMLIQAATFEVVCVGSGSKVISGKPESAFFIVVKSPALTEIRAAVQKLFEENGGKPFSFDATRFYPHITVGFTKQDLHEADGVIKDESSFYGLLTEN